MERIKSLVVILDTFLMGIWGMTIIDLSVMLNLGNFDFINNGIKSLLALAGLLYLVCIKAPSEWRASRENSRIRDAEARKIEMENKTYESSHKDDCS